MKIDDAEAEGGARSSRPDPGHRGRIMGALIGAFFGVIFVEANAGGLPGSVQAVLRIGGAAAATILVIAAFRARKRWREASDAHRLFPAAYWLIVLAEVALLVAGLAVLDIVLGVHDVSVAWIALIVGVHFFGLGRLWRRPALHVLGTALAILGVIGFALHLIGAPATAIALVSGVGSGVVLLLTALRDLLFAREPTRGGAAAAG